MREHREAATPKDRPVTEPLAYVRPALAAPAPFVLGPGPADAESGSIARFVRAAIVANDDVAVPAAGENDSGLVNRRADPARAISSRGLEEA